MPGNFDLHTRYDIKKLAALALYLRDEGFLAPTRSMAIARLLDVLYSKLEKEGKVQDITSVEAAKVILENLGILGTFNSKTNRKLFTTALMAEAAEDERDDNKASKMEEWDKMLT